MGDKKYAQNFSSETCREEDIWDTNAYVGDNIK
jgi:hypothetical protein